MDSTRHAWLLAMVLSGMSGMVPGAQAADTNATAEAAAPVVQAAAPAPPQPAASDAETLREQQRQAIRAKLNGTTWNVQLTSDAGGKKEQDTLIFTDRTIESKRLGKSGYGTSNYSVRVDGDIDVWETMQTKEGEGMAFWRGELYGEKMAGALSQQPKEGAPQNFSFGATKVTSVPPPAPPAAPEVQAPADAAPTAPPEPAVSAPAPVAPKAAMPSAAPSAPQQDKPKKRRGLF